MSYSKYQRTDNNAFINQKDTSFGNQNNNAENQNQNLQGSRNQNKELTNAKEVQNQELSLKNYLVSLGLFVAAFAVFVAVWAVERFAVSHQVTSHYYQKSYNWVSSMPITYRFKVPMNQKSIALQLILQWVMWKAPLLLFTYNCIRLKQGMVKWISLIVVAAICLAADILLTIFALNIYNNMMYYGLFSVLTIIVAVANNSSLDRTKQAVLDSLLPLLCVAILYAIQNLLLPILYTIYIKNLSAEASIFLIFYGYIFVDIIMYALILFMGNYVSKEVRTFYERIHYLLIGYEVGFIMLVGYTEVEFYYLLAYLIFRNVFSNWVMWRWDDVIKIPPILPGWIAPYYFSYVVLFIPFGGIGNIITSVGYYSTILINSTTLLYIYPSSLYPYTTFTAGTLSDFPMNTGFNGTIYWVAGLVIWIATTFTQRYSKKSPQILNSIIYNMWGIYLFYLGIASGISAYSLTTNSLIY